MFQTYQNRVENSLIIGTGRESGAYYAYAEEYKPLLAEDGLDLQIEPTAGSVEVLALLESGEIDIGFVQGGIAPDPNIDGLKSLGSLFFEPVWVFHHNSADIKVLSDLENKKIAISEIGSGTLPLASTLLEINNITEANAELLTIPNIEAAEKLKTGEIDAAFFVMSNRSPLINELVHTPDVELFDFKRGAAYASQLSYLTVLELAEGSIDLNQNLPAQTINIPVVAATLVGRDDLAPAAIDLILSKLDIVHRDSGLFENYNQFPTGQFAEIQMNERAITRLENGPSLAEQLFSFRLRTGFGSLVLSFLPLLFLAIPVFRNRGRLNNYRLRRKINDWYKELSELDNQLESLPAGRIDTEIGRLESLRQYILQTTSISAAHQDDLYDLGLYIDLIITQLRERKSIAQLA